jgi:hypothetical protein
MRYRLGAFVPLYLFAAAVVAQTSTAPSVPAVPAASTDSWATHPAASSSISYRTGPAAGAGAAAKEQFKFKDDHRDTSASPYHPIDQPPPRASDKAAVMGTDRAWEGGRPPLDCAQTPMDPACRH